MNSFKPVMLKVYKLVLLLASVIVSSVDTHGQITSNTSDYVQPTQYTNGVANDQIFVFCSPDINGNPVTGQLTATPTIAGPGFSFDWGLYNDVTHVYTSFQTSNGPSSTVSNLASGGYRVTITNNAGQSQTFITWVYVSTVDVDISLILDPTHPGCEPFDVNGTINASGFTYWDPVPPGAEPFIIDANTTITVCFSANHTYVSDLGFVLVGPPSCGSPGVTLSPHPNVINNANGCCCNSGNNLNNLCFSTANNNQLNMCGSGTPLAGTYGFYNGNFPGTGGANYPQGGIASLFGCNAAEGGWAVQIYDCIGADVGSLTNATITFSNGTSTINYASGPINSTINDNSCTPATASIYVVPLTTPINPNPQQVPNSGTLTYQLGLNGAPVSLAPGTNSFTQTINPIPTYDEWYYLFIQDQLGCSAIDSVMFDFTGYADATIDPINPTNQLCTGNNPVQLTAATAGGVWSGTGVDAAGMFAPATAGTGTHTITYTIPDPCGDIQTMDIIVGDLTANTSSTPSICTADNGTASFTPLTGTSPYTYNWVTNPVQSTQTAIDLPSGNYDVSVADADGCTLSTTVIVGFDPSNLSVSIPNQTNALCNSSCDGTATAVALGGIAPYLFVWDDPSNQQTSAAAALCAGTYNVGIADVNGCLATAQTVISEPTAIVANAMMDLQSNCGNPDGEASVTASGGTVVTYYTYSWNSVPVQTNSAATGLIPATYTATVTDDNGCSESVDVEVTSTPGFTASITDFTNASCFQSCNGTATVVATTSAILPLTYSWNSVPAQTAATATGLCAGNYQVTITDAVNCIASANITITEPTKLSATATTSASPICIGESANLNAIVTGGITPYGSYTWSATPTDPTLLTTTQNPTVSPVFSTIYTLTVSDANGCITAPTTVQVIVKDPLSLNVTRPLASPDTGICPYDFAVIDLIATGGDGTYSYYLNPDLSTPVGLPMQVQPASTTTYNFTVRDGCTTPPAFASSTITVFILPVVDFVGDELTGCHIHTVDFSDNTNPTPVTWNWDFDDADSGANTSTSQNPNHQFSQAGTYTVSLQVQTADGCVADTTKTDYIEVYPLPYANFSMDPEVTNVLDGMIEFTDLSTGQINEWNWNFGTGDGSIEQNPTYTYTDTGSYIVWLNVTTINGCEGETRKQVVIEPDFMFYVPNSFSPNNDGRNDYFRGYGEGVNWDSYELTIYNRWGEEIFFSADIDQPWNGDFKQMDVANEVYVWTIRVNDLKGDPHTYRGHVTVLR